MSLNEFAPDFTQSFPGSKKTYRIIACRWLLPALLCALACGYATADEQAQRIAKFYMLHAWGFETILVNEEIEAARNEFSAALAKLVETPENTVDITEELNAVKLQWDWFQAALALEGAYSYRMVVADASESILNHMDHITRMYEELAHANRNVLQH